MDLTVLNGTASVYQTVLLDAVHQRIASLSPTGVDELTSRPERHCCMERPPRATASTSPPKDDRSGHGRVVRPFLGVLP
jgi:hypothetical protein